MIVAQTFAHNHPQPGHLSGSPGPANCYAAHSMGPRAVDRVKSGHSGARDLTMEGEDCPSVGAELDMISVDPSLKLAVLVRPMEGTGKDIAVLRELNLLQRAARVICVLGVDRPVAGEVLHRCVVGDAGALRWASLRRALSIGKIGSQAEFLIGLA